MRLVESPANRTPAAPVLPTGSIDRVRLIRRSMRCFTFGLLGVVPVFGAGFAWQALRLRRAISAEVGDAWEPPPVYCYWVIGMIAVLVSWQWLPLAVAGTVFPLVIGIQTWHCWRSFISTREVTWNPGRIQLLWGVILAYAGLGFSLWALVSLVLIVGDALQAAV